MRPFVERIALLFFSFQGGGGYSADCPGVPGAGPTTTTTTTTYAPPTTFAPVVIDANATQVSREHLHL